MHAIARTVPATHPRAPTTTKAADDAIIIIGSLRLDIPASSWRSLACDSHSYASAD